MNLEEILKIVTDAIAQAEAGREVERSKIDFKLRWYDLRNDKERNEFVKDTSAIANTFGPDGFIVIGFDPAPPTKYQDAKFSDCNLKDTSDMLNLLKDAVTFLFDVDVHEISVSGHTLSVIHLPPSIDKPHVIHKFKRFDRDGVKTSEEANRIFVRKLTTNSIATRSDIELMYYDRKNVIPEYEIATSFSLGTVITNTGDTHASMEFIITIENLGRRPVAIDEISFELQFLFRGITEFDKLSFRANLIGDPICLQPGNIRSQRVKFLSSEPMNVSNLHERKELREELAQQRGNAKNILFTMGLSNQKVVQSQPLVKT